jgi:hypothetical protein
VFENRPLRRIFVYKTEEYSSEELNKLFYSPYRTEGANEGG